MKRLAESGGTNEETARQGIVHSLGGVPLGRSALRKKWRNLLPFLLRAVLEINGILKTASEVWIGLLWRYKKAKITLSLKN